MEQARQFAKEQGALEKPLPEGGTQRQALQVVEKRLGKPLPELHGNTIPYCFEHLWEMLKDMMVGRQYANGNLLPLSASEILSWCDINQIKLEPWEARALRQMDVAFLEGLSK